MRVRVRGRSRSRGDDGGEQPAAGRSDLTYGRGKACPGYSDRLRPHGHTRIRTVRPQLTRCDGCGRSQVLLPVRATGIVEQHDGNPFGEPMNNLEAPGHGDVKLAQGANQQTVLVTLTMS